MNETAVISFHANKYQKTTIRWFSMLVKVAFYFCTITSRFVVAMVVATTAKACGQARPLSGVTEAAEKIFGGAQTNLPTTLGEKTEKKFFLMSSSWPFTFFWVTNLAWGAYSLHGGARRNLMVRISLLAHKFRGEEQKK